MDENIGNQSWKHSSKLWLMVRAIEVTAPSNIWLFGATNAVPPRRVVWSQLNSIAEAYNLLPSYVQHRFSLERKWPFRLNGKRLEPIVINRKCSPEILMPFELPLRSPWPPPPPRREPLPTKDPPPPPKEIHMLARVQRNAFFMLSSVDISSVPAKLEPPNDPPLHPLPPRPAPLSPRPAKYYKI